MLTLKLKDKQIWYCATPKRSIPGLDSVKKVLFMFQSTYVLLSTEPRQRKVGDIREESARTEEV